MTLSSYPIFNIQRFKATLFKMNKQLSVQPKSYLSDVFATFSSAVPCKTVKSE